MQIVTYCITKICILQHFTLSMRPTIYFSISTQMNFHSISISNTMEANLCRIDNRTHGPKTKIQTNRDKALVPSPSDPSWKNKEFQKKNIKIGWKIIESSRTEDRPPKRQLAYPARPNVGYPGHTLRDIDSKPVLPTTHTKIGGCIYNFFYHFTTHVLDPPAGFRIFILLPLLLCFGSVTFLFSSFPLSLTSDHILFYVIEYLHTGIVPTAP